MLNMGTSKLFRILVLGGITSVGCSSSNSTGSTGGMPAEGSAGKTGQATGGASSGGKDGAGGAVGSGGASSGGASSGGASSGGRNGSGGVLGSGGASSGGASSGGRNGSGGARHAAQSGTASAVRRGVPQMAQSAGKSSARKRDPAAFGQESSDSVFDRRKLEKAAPPLPTVYPNRLPRGPRPACGSLKD